MRLTLLICTGFALDAGFFTKVTIGLTATSLGIGLAGGTTAFGFVVTVTLTLATIAGLTTGNGLAFTGTATAFTTSLTTALGITLTGSLAFSTCLIIFV